MSFRAHWCLFRYKYTGFMFQVRKKVLFVIILLELFLISFLFLIIFINFAGKISRVHLAALIIVHCKLLIIHYIVLWKRLR